MTLQSTDSTISTSEDLTSSDSSLRSTHPNGLADIDRALRAFLPEANVQVEVEDFLVNALHAPNKADLERTGLLHALEGITSTKEYKELVQEYCTGVETKAKRCSTFVTLLNWAKNEVQKVIQSKELRTRRPEGSLLESTSNEVDLTFCVDGHLLVGNSYTSNIVGVVSAARLCEGNSTVDDQDRGEGEVLEEGEEDPSSLTETFMHMWQNMLTFFVLKEGMQSEIPMIKEPLKFTNITNRHRPDLRSKKRPLERHHEEKQEAAATRSATFHRLQCADLATKMLNYGGIRMHVLGAYINNDEMELILYTRSRICYTFSFSFIFQSITFLRVVLALSRLTYRQWGLFDSLLPTTFGFPKLLSGRGVDLFEGRTFVVEGSMFRAKRAIMFPRGLLGRGTWVIEVVAVEGPVYDQVGDTELIMKVSSLGHESPHEVDFIDKARSHANAHGHEWVLDHLPNVVARGSLNPEESLKKLLGADFEREISFMIAVKLRPITTLTDPLELAKVFEDIINCHRWLVEHPKILHRDISLDNLMCVWKSGKVYGVLNDFDSACDYTFPGQPTGGRLIGTKPFAALEILEPPEAVELQLHRIRHDLESFIYVFAWIVARRLTHDREVSSPPFEGWRQGTREEIHARKSIWLSFMDSGPPLSPTYDKLFPIYHGLRRIGWQGLSAGRIRYSAETRNPPPFDEETWGGHLTHDKMLEVFDRFAASSRTI